MNGKALRIYVAGPYTPQTKDVHDAARIAYQNTRAAIRMGIELIKKGHIPFVPHLTHYLYLESDVELPAVFWYEFDMATLEICDALFYLAPSRGADNELRWAQEHGLTIFRSLDDVPDNSGVE